MTKSKRNRRKKSAIQKSTVWNKLFGTGAVVALLVLNAGLFVWDKYSTRDGQLSESVAALETEATRTPDVVPQMQSAGEIEPGVAQTLIPSSTDPVFDREAILSDSESRIDDQFTIPSGLRDRAGFWFDVYSKYDENKRIIHNARMPWIVYKVVDVSDIINSTTPKARWMRNMKADKVVDAEIALIRKAIQSVASRRHLNKLSEAEQAVVNALLPLGGKVQARARAAMGETRVQIGQKNFFAEGLRISPRYLPEMERIFVEKKLPIELTRLPFVESSFNKFATSKDGAAGIWQFMDGTGSKFMLINGQIDERRSPFKASEAAARLLKENHMILHRSWPLALTAYNHGPGGVRAAIKAMGTKDLSKIVGKYRTKNFSFASSNFYCEFLGALHAQMYKDKIWGDFETEPSLNVHVVRLPRAFRAKQLVRLTGMTDDQLVLHNPDLRKVMASNGLVPRGFRFHVPNDIRGKVEGVLLAKHDNERRVSKVVLKRKSV